MGIILDYRPITLIQPLRISQLVPDRNPGLNGAFDPSISGDQRAPIRPYPRQALREEPLLYGRPVEKNWRTLTETIKLKRQLFSMSAKATFMCKSCARATRQRVSGKWKTLQPICSMTAHVRSVPHRAKVATR